MSGDRNPFYGHTHSEELKQRFSEHFTGKKNPNAGKKIAALWNDEDGVYRKLMSSDTYRKLVSTTTQAYWNSSKSEQHRETNRQLLQELRPSYTQKLLEVFATDAYRSRLSERVKQNWASLTPEMKDARCMKFLSTMMLNGSLCSSAERELLCLLRAKYPNTKHGVWFHKSVTSSTRMWNIDFYIPEIDTYVQFDGAYWHGLDRPIDQIKNSASKRDQSIYAKWLLDREQDAWFSENRKCLIRITDVEFRKSREHCLERIACGN